MLVDLDHPTDKWTKVLQVLEKLLNRMRMIHVAS